MLKWFGHVESLDEYSISRRGLMTKVIGERVRSRLKLGWTDSSYIGDGN